MAHRYTDQEKTFIREYAYGHSYKSITDECNRRFDSGLKVKQIRAYLKNNKIRTGRTGRFPKGHVPDNKGKKMPTIGRMGETQFKRGNLPANHKPVGTESVRNNYKRGHKYVYVKVAEPNKWRMKHIVIWEQHHGVVPKGKIVLFLDGDSLNTDIDNLALVDRNTHARLNQMHLRSGNRELTETGIVAAELVCSIAKAGKRLKEG